VWYLALNRPRSAMTATVARIGIPMIMWRACSPVFFRIALDGMAASPATTLHVGDLYHVDVVGARAAGLRAALLDPASLYEGADCPRYATLADLAEDVVRGRVEG